MSVVCFGELLLRLTAPGHERLFQSPSLSVVFGGSEANVATSLSRFGIATEYVTRLPTNRVGDAALRALRAEEVGTTHVLRSDGRLGIYFVEVGAAQRPTLVLYDRAPSTMTEVDAGTFEWDRIVDRASWLHVSGITAALGPGPAACTLAAMRAAKSAGVTVSFDLNYRGSLWDVETAAPVLQRLATEAHLLIAGEDHFEPLLGIAPGQDMSARTAERFGASRVAITRRESRSASRTLYGAQLWEGGVTHTAPEYDIDVVDRIGSGDAFCAGLIYGIYTGRSPAEALRFAVAAGALKHTIPGDTNRVGVEDVDRLAGGDGSGRVLR